jgi:hypothetical protein
MALRESVSDGVRVLHDDAARRNDLIVAFTDRHGGASRAPYASLNLAARVGDDLAAVTENRRRAGASIGFEVGALALARQVHGVGVLEVTEGCSGVVGEADVLVTSTPGVILGILTADCAPVVLAGDSAIAIVHAGWRGLVGGAVEAGVRAIGTVRSAWIGPCIHSCCYEVGGDVIAAFEEAGLPVAGPDRVDPRHAAEHLLARAGVDVIETVDECTFCNARYFSYRRDGVTGRQGTFAALAA